MTARALLNGFSVRAPAFLLSLLAVAVPLACSEDPTTEADAGVAALDAAPKPDAAPVIRPDAAAAPADDATTADDAAANDDAGPSFSDAEPACARNDAGRCVLLTWTATAAFPVAVDHHTAFVLSSTTGDYIHIVGGVRNAGDVVQEVYTAVRRARIAADGMIGAWEDTTPLPTPKAFHAQAVHNGYVYLLAGVTADMTGPGASLTVLIGHMNGDGTVRAWFSGTRLPAVVRLHATAAVVHDHLYLIGGSSQEPLNNVTVAPIMADGSIGAWTAGTALPAARSHHAAVVWDDRIYLIGGFGAGQAQANPVLRSVHDATGALTGWEEVGTMPEAPWTSGAFVRNDFIYVVGGGEGSSFFSKYVDRVRRAPIGADGHVGAFEDVAAPLPRPRSHVHHAPYFNGHIYSIGGRREQGLISLGEWTIGTFQ